MIQFCMALAGFALLFLGDYNSIKWRRSILRPAFFFFSSLIAAAVITDLSIAFYLGAVRNFDFFLLGLGIFFFVGLIYALFFAIPFQESYTEPQAGRKTCRTGLYALCRHSGVWFFFLMILCFGIAALPSPLLWRGLLYTLFNVIYSWFQDKYIFPKVFCDHGDYCGEVPFLIPTSESLHRFFHSGAKEE